MPKDYYAGDKRPLCQGLADGKQMFTTDGMMPADGPETVLQGAGGIQQDDPRARHIDLSKTYTTEFVKAMRDDH